MNRRTLARAFWPLAAFACLALAACSGSNASETADGEITTDDLAAMLLPTDSVQAGGFQMNVDPALFGVTGKDLLLLNSYNPVDDEADTVAYGWQTDYVKWFVRTDLASPITYVSTGVSLYATEAGAAADLVNEIEDLQNNAGNTNPRGATLISAQGFVARSVEAARGVRIVSVLNGDTSYITVVKFVRGNIVGGVGIAAVDDRDMRAEAEAFANLLADQVSTVITGQSPTPVPTPAPTPVPTEAPAESPAA